MSQSPFNDIRTHSLAARLLTIILRRDNLIARIDLAVQMGKMTKEKAAELKESLR